MADDTRRRRPTPRLNPTTAQIVFWTLAVVGTAGLGLIFASGFTGLDWIALVGTAMFAPCPLIGVVLYAWLLQAERRDRNDR